MNSTALLIHHIQAVKKIDGLTSAHIIFIPESNLAFEGIHLEQELYRSNIQGICIMREDDNRAGVRVNREFKKVMALQLRYKLMDKSVYLHQDFVCIGTDNDAESMIKEIIDQLLNYTRIMKPSNDVHKAPTESYGGKMGHGFDDHAIALMLNLVMKNRFFLKEEQYEKWY